MDNLCNLSLISVIIFTKTYRIKNMRVLAIDTSSSVLGVALLDEEGREVEFNYRFELRHASHLVPTIRTVLAFAGLALGDLDAFCISIGPGSFTGLRIGVSTIKALALVHDKKVAAVPSLDAIARNIACVPGGGKICVLIDAKKEKFYSCLYEYAGGALRRRSPYRLTGWRDLAKVMSGEKAVIVVGDGTEKITGSPTGLSRGHYTVAGKEYWLPRAMTVARIGMEMIKRGDVVKDIDALVPLYLHPRDVQCNKKAKGSATKIGGSASSGKG